MANNKDFKVKNGIKPTVYQETLGTVVSATQGYYISGASYDSVSFDFSSQFSYPFAFGFADSGTKMYGQRQFSGGTLYQYTLSTAYDISTASYANKSYSFANGASGFVITPDGSSLYISANDGDAVYRYTFGTAFDASTLSNGTQMFSTSSVDTQPDMCKFNSDGSKFFLLGKSNNRIYEYSVSTAYDLTTATYSNNSLLVSAQAAGPLGFDFSADGTSLVVSDNTTDSVYLYTLTTGYDLTTATYSGTNFSVSSQDSAPGGMSFINNGSKLLILGQANSLIYQYSTALSTASLDLSTGSVFDYTPTANAQVTLTNPAASGTASGATLLLGSEDSTGVGSTFSTTLYTGTGAAKTISNGLDLSTDGGLVWIKRRDSAGSYSLWDSGRGISNWLSSDTTSAQVDYTTTAMVSFNTDGFTLGVDTVVNRSAASWVSWAFKKQTKFFDIQTWTGNTVAGRTVSHNLGLVPGMIMVKRLNTSEGWYVYHRSMDATSPEDYYIQLDTNEARVGPTSSWNYTAPTSTHFVLDADSAINGSGNTYVAYLFAHDTDASSLIKCGSYTGTGSANNAVTLGWEPQWLIVKSASGTGSVQNWDMFDNQRGFSSGSTTGELFPNTSIAERNSGNRMNATTTGFSTGTSSVDEINSSGVTYIYMAIRSPSVPTVTYDPNLQWSGGTAPTLPATGEKDVITFNTTDGGTTYKSALAIDGAK